MSDCRDILLPGEAIAAEPLCCIDAAQFRCIETEQPRCIEVVVRASPFRTDVTRCFAPPGRTIDDLVAEALPDALLRQFAQAWLVGPDGEPWPVPRALWARVRPRPGIRLFVAPVPQGRGFRRIARAVLAIAIAVAGAALGGPIAGALGFTAGTTAFFVASAVAAAAITFVGGLALNALIPVGKPRLSELGGLLAAASPSTGAALRTEPTLAGSSNAARPWQPVPRIYGRIRVSPPKAARDVTESVGDATYLRCLFDCGYGPLDLSDLRIGTTPISQFEGVDIEIRNGWPSDLPVTLYSRAVRQDAYSLKVTNAGGPQQIESRDNAIELGLDLAFQGLFEFTDQGTAQPLTVRVRIEYWPVAGGAVASGEHDITANATGLYTRSFRFAVAQGRYAVRVTRLTADHDTDPRRRSAVFIAALRTVQPDPAVRATGRCLVALRIKASDQLNGTIDEFSVLAQALLPTWTGSAWTAPVATRNPAWAYLDVLRGTANRFPAGDDRLALADFLAWAGRCDAVQPDGGPRHTFDAAIDARSTVFQVLSDIAGAGRAAPGMRDGRFSVVEDIPQSVPIQHFTPRNSWGFAAVKTFSERWHGLRVRYLEPDRDWQQAEIVVYNDGHDETNATRIDTLELLGCTRRSQAVRDARYHLAAGTLRPETYELTCDVENLLCTRGDLVRVSHDVPLWGSGWGRVRSLVMAGPNVAGVVLDERIAVRDDRSYRLRWRRADAAGDVADIVPTIGGIDADADTFTFKTPRAPEAAPAIGDLAMVGEVGRDSAELIVKAIEPGPDLSARLILVDAAPGVHTADTGPIAAFDPLLTQPVVVARRMPAAPQLLEVFSGTAALLRGSDGTVLARIGVRLRGAEGEAAPGGFQVRWRRQGTEEWSLAVGTGPSVLTGPVLEGEAYEVQARTITVAGLASAWTTTVLHLVVGKQEPPGDVGKFLIAGRRLDWESVRDLDLAGYVLRWNRGHNTSWETATPLHGGLLTDNPFMLGSAFSGQATVLIKAVDTGGRESLAPAVILTDLGDPLLEGDEAAARDFRLLGWPGGIVGASIVAGDLMADEDGSDPIWTDPALPIWRDDAALIYVERYFAMTFIGEVAFDDPPPASRALFKETIAGDLVAVEWTPDPPMWGADDGAPIWTGDALLMWYAGVTWQPWPGALPEPPPFLLRVQIAGGPSRGTISRLRALLDAPRILENFADLAIPETGLRLPITRAYRSISTVQLTTQGGAARTASVVDKDRLLGPLVRTFDLAGAPVPAIVDATITGY